MTRPRSAPMPAGLRRTRRHPALNHPCPHCRAAPLARCTTPSSGITRTEPHPSRIATWAVATAVCPTCQVSLGTPCHHDGTPLDHDVHPARLTEAKETAA